MLRRGAGAQSLWAAAGRGCAAAACAAAACQHPHAPGQQSLPFLTTIIQLGAASCPPNAPFLPLQAFLAGVAVGLQLPAAGRHRTAVQRALLGVLIVGALAVLGGSALLLAGFVEAHPQVVYYA